MKSLVKNVNRPYKYKPHEPRPQISKYNSKTPKKPRNGLLGMVSKHVEPILSAINHKIGGQDDGSGMSNSKSCQNIDTGFDLDPDRGNSLKRPNISPTKAQEPKKFSAFKQKPAEVQKSASEKDDESSDEPEPQFDVYIMADSTQKIDSKMSPEPFMNEDTIDFNESKMSPEKQISPNIPDFYLSPNQIFEKRPKSELMSISDIASVDSNNDKNKSVNNDVEIIDHMFADLDRKQSYSDIKRNSMLIAPESLDDSKRRQTIVTFKNVNLMKSQLPPSHMPHATQEDSKKEEVLAEKLQAMQRHDSVDDVSKSDITSQMSVKPEPKFLEAKTSQESLEELARIDAELAK